MLYYRRCQARRGHATSGGGKTVHDARLLLAPLARSLSPGSSLLVYMLCQGHTI